MGRYHVVRQIGEGGMSVVYEAIDRERGARVALKTSADLVSCRLRPVQTEVSLLRGRWEAHAVSTFCSSEGWLSFSVRT